MSDPQAKAEQLDEDEDAPVVPPDKFITPENWDAGAGSTEEDDGEVPLNAEDAALHVERGIAADGE